MTIDPMQEKVSLNEAIEELNLYKNSFISSLRNLLLLSKSLNIPIHFDYEVIGYKVGEDLEEVEKNGEIDKVMVLGEVSFFNENLSTVNADCFYKHGYHHLEIYDFIYDGSAYYTISEDQMCLEQQTFNINYCYLYTTDLNNLISRLESASGSSQISHIKDIANANSKSVLKALALFAREKADTDSSFIKGNEVNGSKIADHLVTLANKYGVSKLGLSSIDDKVNPMLEDLDIKEIK